MTRMTLPKHIGPLFAAALAAALATGCWGSASESPWPAEPADVDLGPAGEAEATADPKAQKPTNVRQGAGSGPPSSAKKPPAQDPKPKASESKP